MERGTKTLVKFFTCIMKYHQIVGVAHQNGSVSLYFNIIIKCSKHFLFKMEKILYIYIIICVVLSCILPMNIWQGTQFYCFKIREPERNVRRIVELSHSTQQVKFQRRHFSSIFLYFSHSITTIFIRFDNNFKCKIYNDRIIV